MLPIRVLFTGSLLFGMRLTGQAPATSIDSLNIEVAAARFIRDSVSNGDVRFESWSTLHSRALVARPDARNAAIGVILRATSARKEDVLACAGTPARCELAVGHFVSISQPIISGGSATVYVDHDARSGRPRLPVFSREYELRLKAVRGSWALVSAKLVRVN